MYQEYLSTNGEAVINWWDGGITGDAIELRLAESS